MKINGSGDRLPIERPTTSATSGAKQSGQTAATDTVHLSGLAEQLARTVTEQQPGAVFDQARVDAIKAAISSGEFHVDSEVVADRLLQSVQELLTRS